MNLRKIELRNFRNYEHVQLDFDPGVNLIVGDNAQGKTNLLEACWLFTGGRSFRGAKDSELVQFGADYAKLGLTFEAGSREQEATIPMEIQFHQLGVEIVLPGWNIEDVKPDWG